MNTHVLRAAASAGLDCVRLTILIVASALLQVTIAPDMVVLGGHPDLVVLAVVAVALQRGPIAGSVVGFGAGVLVDALGLGVIGVSSLALVGVGYLVGVWAEQIDRSAALRPLAAVAIASFAASVAELGIAALVGLGRSVATQVWFAAVPGAILNVLIAIAVYPLLRRVLGGIQDTDGRR